ncbi:MAG: magnesium/cobalt transporter CorA [Candidatus Sericytochromatia bacterium]|nr:magnesium/cobalt transporter CorA [Candidatus Tanganyikabacteria bacterium]
MAWRVQILDPATHMLVPHQTERLPERPTGAGVVWIDLVEPTEPELKEIGRMYGLHHLALEDCLHDGQRPKLDAYENHVFMVLHHPRFEAKHHRMVLDELDMFLGPNFVITSHHRPLALLETVRERWAEAEEARTEGAPFLAYLICDTAVDDYFPVLDKLEDRLAVLDERVFREHDHHLLEEAFRLKKQLLHLRRIVGPTRDVFVWLLRHEAPLISRATVLHFQDVYDHLIRVSDALDLYRDLAGGVQETYLTMAANRMNVSMKRLTAFTITLMLVTLVSSVYGMNFHRIPELSWPHGYYFALGLMAALGTTSLAIFKFRGYF